MFTYIACHCYDEGPIYNLQFGNCYHIGLPAPIAKTEKGKTLHRTASNSWILIVVSLNHKGNNPLNTFITWLMGMPGDITETTA